MLFREGIRFDLISEELWLRSIIWSKETATSLSERDFPTNRDMILSSADFVNDRQIVLSGVGTFQIFLFVWNILLEFEKKHLCNSIPWKSSDYLISYLDIFILQKFDPTYLQAFLSIETIATLCNEIFPLKCSSSLRFYFSKFDFFLRSFLHTFLLSYTYTLELYAELQRVTEVSSLYLFWFMEFVHIHCQPSQ